MQEFREQLRAWIESLPVDVDEYPQELRFWTERYGVELGIEHVADRLGQDGGRNEMLFVLEGGNLRKSRLNHVDIGNVELRLLDRPTV